MMTTQVLDRGSLKGLAHAYYFSCALHAAVKLGIADVLAAGPLPLATIARKTETHPESLARLLRFLGSVGLFEEEAESGFRLTDVGQFLRSNHPQSLAREISMFSGEETYLAWGSVLHSIRTGGPAFDQIYGKPLFEYFEGHAEVADKFHRSWQEITTVVAAETASAFDFQRCSTVADVGCGYGVFMGTVLKQHPHLQGILYDLPVSLGRTKETLASFGVEDRGAIVAGDAQISAPSGADVYFIKSVLHGCDDAQCVRILSNCAKVLPEGGRVVVIERVIPEDPGFHWSKLVDMTMLVMTGGKERTEADYGELYARSGLALTSCLSLPSGFSLVEAKRAGAR
jgi:hypothetical protein